MEAFQSKPNILSIYIKIQSSKLASKLKLVSKLNLHQSLKPVPKFKTCINSKFV